MFLDPEEYDMTMMGKTHLFMGITAAAVLTRPDTVGGCLAALMGGAVGGVLSDIDVKSGKGRRDDPAGQGHWHRVRRPQRQRNPGRG